jgi:hypothetical protein
MADEELRKQVEVPVEHPEVAKLRRTIASLQVLYFVLFSASLVLLVVNFGHKSAEQHLFWAIALGGAVIVRLIRTSLVNKYNRLVLGDRPAPLT